MLQRIIRFVVGAGIVLVPMSSLAQYDTTQLFSSGAWYVERTYNVQSGSIWCSGETMNARGQIFSITTYDTGNANVFIFDDMWSLRERPVRFLIDIDYSRWIIDGSALDSSVSVQIMNAEKGVEFLTELAEGRAVAVYNEQERRLATFSLVGSRAALSSLMNCWSSIIIDRDPFDSYEDPFS